MEISKNKTLFILDWDDTLFPTNWVMKNNINLMIPNSRDRYTIYFEQLDRVLSSFLKKLLKMGKVVIVTNALTDWVNVSSEVLPHTYQLLKKVDIVSARGRYKGKTTQIMDWKILAFRDVINEEFKNTDLMNVISIGDAEYEYQALISLNDQKKGIKKYLKSIKFLREPTHDTLIDQIQVITYAINDVWSSDKHLDLKFNNSRKK
jgi:hypothetical protein